MRVFAKMMACGVVLGISGSALAADLTTAELKEFISGKSLYLQLTGDSASGVAGQGVIYYAADGTSLYKTPTGATWRGTWVTKDNQLCVDWKERPNNSCVRYAKNGDKVTVHQANSGALRATVVKTVAGNAEGLVP
jgi:hypothetical protein